MEKRRKLTRLERKLIYDKMNGHCAYCGCKLDIKAMQVDHIEPLSRGGADELRNMFPSCRSCNHFKDGMTIEGLREAVEKWTDILMRDSVTYRNAVRFGLILPNPHQVLFYFENHAARIVPVRGSL